MFLTSMTLRGFKSFADTTTLEVEPGVTMVVGPNGSGKSNIVDALAWVMGTAAPTKVRSGQMADVIFAGSPTRSPLGQARVEITIDNSEGQLGTDALGTGGSAQQFPVVRVAREVYASGESSYQINGEEVRALDIQELLSDAGLGRELHTVVGQGQLDEILNARPEDRRAYVEEAAGILKHRRRRERALRKLDRVTEHTGQLERLVGQLRRQLEPLERQAEAASKHDRLQARLRDVRMRLAAQDLAALRERERRDDRDEAERTARLEEAREELERLTDAAGRLEQEVEELGPRAEQSERTLHRLGSLLERLRGTGELIEARRRHLLEYVEEPVVGRPPEQLRTQAQRLDDQREQRQAEHEAARDELEEAVAARKDAEAARREHEAARQAGARRWAEQREHVLRWEGRVSSLRGSIEASEAELDRVTDQLGDLDQRLEETRAETERVESRIQRLDAREMELGEALDEAEHRVRETEQRIEELVERQRDLERERSSQQARVEALRGSLQEHWGGAVALLEGEHEGVLGTVGDYVRVRAGADHALAAALGRLDQAVITTTPERSRRLISWLRDHEAGDVALLAARSVPVPETTLDEDAVQRLETAEAVPAGELLRPTGEEDSDLVLEALRNALSDCWVVDSWDRAVLLHGRNPELTFVTRDGDLAGPRGYVGGSAGDDGSGIPTPDVVAEAEERVAALRDELESVERDLTAARRELERRREQLAVATDRINESDAQITGAAEELVRLEREEVAWANQREVVAAQREELEEALERDRRRLGELEEDRPSYETDPSEYRLMQDEAQEEAAQRLDEAVEEAREVELEARGRCERLSEQIRQLAQQAEELRAEAAEVEEQVARAARRRELRRKGIARCGELSALCSSTIEALEVSVRQAEQARDRLHGGLRERRDQLRYVQERVAGAREDLEEAREVQHGAELRRTDLQNDLERIRERIREDFGLTPDELLEQHPEAVEKDRSDLEEQRDALVGKLELLGQVNPLALEEYEALEARHRFLSGQLQDLRASKRDLEEVVEAVDDRIADIFEEAFADVQREFQRLFEVMFPGGEGQLMLTDPEDMLTTGIEIEAQPPGKRVTRLSLLSGGERSLTVLAFVFAIFRARPSPFYVLDEVDAALDDVNLRRLLEVIESFRDHAQILMVTHQKQSMEIADVMYGITMGEDAVSKVVTERLQDRERLDAALPAPEGHRRATASGGGAGGDGQPADSAPRQREPVG